ncbi:MAG: Smr/MutS family protein [Christensenellales bacterium]
MTEIDLHGKTLFQARVMVDSALRRATSADYRLRVVHGYRQGSALRDMLRQEYLHHPKVLRIEPSFNPGETIFVLREYY